MLRIILLLLGLWVSASAEETIKYGGLRVDMSALTFNRDVISTVIPALNRTLMLTFPEYSEKGPTFTMLKISNIHIKAYNINESRFVMDKITYQEPIYTLEGCLDAIVFHLSFNFEQWQREIPIAAGKGTAIVTSLKSLITVIFSGPDPDVRLPNLWDIKDVTLPSSIKSTAWIASILHKSFIPDFHKAVENAMHDCGHNLFTNYRHIKTIFPYSWDLVFRNEWRSVAPTMNETYLTIAFSTDMTARSSIKRKIYRIMDGTMTPKGDFHYCLTAELVPDVMDVLEKAEYYFGDIPSWTWGLATDQVKEFFEIIPSLREIYQGNEEYGIRCEQGKHESIKDITVRGQENPPLRLQFGQDCMFFVKQSGEQFLSVHVFLHFFYEIRSKYDVFSNYIKLSQLYDFKVLPTLPPAAYERFKGLVSSYASFYSGCEIMSPGIRVTPYREEELLFQTADVGPEEICFHYNEARPITSNGVHSSQR